MKNPTFLVNNKNKVLIVAELSANHNGSLDTAIDTIKAAKRAGADSIKLQTYTADTITLDSKKDDFIIKESIWKGQYLHTLYKKAFTPWEWHEKLFSVAKEEGLICFSSPFDRTAVDFLEKLGNPIYKIASLEITDIPLIQYIASKRKPIIISTGIGTYEDIKLAVETCKNNGNNDITLLKCTTAYPAPIEEANLAMMTKFAEDFDVKVGLSDHTMGSTLPILAAALGAKIIEKHFIIDRSVGGPDASFSMNEHEFTEMVKAIRQAEIAFGKIDYNLTEKQIKGRKFRRSLYVVEDIKKGDVITEKNVKSIRPGFGIHPKYLPEILGKKITKDTFKGERFDFSFIK